MHPIDSLLSQRTDLSPYLVHFTRDTQASAVTARDNLLSILQDRQVEARNTYGMARELAIFPQVAATQKTVSFSETPLEHAWMMCADIKGRSKRFNGYGLAFDKDYARRKGVNPVWYLDKTLGHDWLTISIDQLKADAVSAAPPSGAKDPDPDVLAKAPILRLTPFIDQMGNPSGPPKEFSWEREWRCVGDFSFARADVVAVLAPEREHAAIQDSLTGPGFRGYKTTMPRFLDVQWEPERIAEALEGASEPDSLAQETAPA